jgi:hypothetical protein
VNALLCSRGEHVEPVPAVAVFHWPATDATQPGLCADCLKCCIGTCTTAPVVLDEEYDELWCGPHWTDYSEGESTDGLTEIVLVDSDRFREITAAADPNEYSGAGVPSVPVTPPADPIA